MTQKLLIDLNKQNLMKKGIIKITNFEHLLIMGFTNKVT